MDMFNEFMTAFRPFFTGLFSVFNAVLETVMSPNPNRGIQLFGIPIIAFPLAFMFLGLIVNAVFRGGVEE